jgi:hypothetical protein
MYASAILSFGSEFRKWSLQKKVSTRYVFILLVHSSVKYEIFYIIGSAEFCFSVTVMV